MNSVHIIGRLTKDPEVKQAAGGTSMCRFTVAVNRPKKQEGKPDADFINCTTFGKTAENLGRYQHKGMMIAVTGRIQTGSYTNQQGQKIFTTDVYAENVEYLEWRDTQNQPAQGANYGAQATNYSRANNYSPNGNYAAQGYSQSGYANGNAYDGYGNESISIDNSDLPF